MSPQEAQWRRIKMEGIRRLTVEKGWLWGKAVRGGTRLQLVSPRGVVWDFKLNGGAAIRRAKSD